MAILGIDNRTENWRTALSFSQMLRDGNLRLKLAKKLGEPDGTQPDKVQMELYWKGMRDYVYPLARKKKPTPEELAGRYRRLFPDLREKIEGFREEIEGSSKFRELRPWNYDASKKEQWDKLRTNLVNTEIDIVLETPNHLFIGEAKHEMGFGANGDLVLVHQLIRQYVMAKILISRLVSDEQLESEKRVVPFVVRDKPEGREQAQIEFMIAQRWLDRKNVLLWDDIRALHP